MISFQLREYAYIDAQHTFLPLYTWPFYCPFSFYHSSLFLFFTSLPFSLSFLKDPPPPKDISRGNLFNIYTTYTVPIQLLKNRRVPSSIEGLNNWYYTCAAIGILWYNGLIIYLGLKFVFLKTTTIGFNFIIPLF